MLISTVDRLKKEASVKVPESKAKKNINMGQSIPLTSKYPSKHTLEPAQRSLDDLPEEGHGSTESLVRYGNRPPYIRPQSSKIHYIKHKNLLTRSTHGKLTLSKRFEKQSLQSIEQQSGTNNTSNINMQSRSGVYP